MAGFSFIHSFLLNNPYFFREQEEKRKGVALALGSLHTTFIRGKEEEIIENLIRCSR